MLKVLSLSPETLKPETCKPITLETLHPFYPITLGTLPHCEASSVKTSNTGFPEEGCFSSLRR